MEKVLISASVDRMEEGVFVFDVPRDAMRCRVPNDPLAPPWARGQSFFRCKYPHRLWGLPMFVRITA